MKFIDVTVFSYILPRMQNKKIAIVHDWLTGMRGGEKVLEILCELYPDATLFTLVHEKGKLSPAIERMDIRTSFLQRMPYGTTRYRYYLPLFPRAIENFDLRGYDLIISSSHAAAKGVWNPDRVPHVCYCHTPMRYVWDQYEQYFGAGGASIPVRAAMKMFRGYLQRWDVRTAQCIDRFIANSRFVQERIKRIYGKDSVVVYPPVDVKRFAASAARHPGLVSGSVEDYYLIVSALVPYKRIDLAVTAFNRLKKPLRIIGLGAEVNRLRSMAESNITFYGWQSDEEIAKAYAGCKALVFPGEEDFGIVPVEAMACGKPVIGFGKGGLCETVIDGTTGVLFPEQTAESLVQAVEKFEGMTFDAEAIRQNAMRFDKEIFREKIGEIVDGVTGG